MNDQTVWLTWLIFVVTYGGLALGKAPELLIDWAGIAFVGATFTRCPFL